MIGHTDEPGGSPSHAAQPGPVPELERSDPLWQALAEVRDPELPISLVDLGLIYALRRRQEWVEVDLTFTATACPCMDFIREDIRERLLGEPGISEVRIREVWEPPWSPDRITARGREQLRQMGVSL